MKTRIAATANDAVNAGEGRALEREARMTKAARMIKKIKVKKHCTQRPASRMELAWSGVCRGRQLSMIVRPSNFVKEHHLTKLKSLPSA